jgi:putative phage-type endonuclease
MQASPSDLDQRTPEWYEARKGLVTASSVGAILNLDPYREPRDVLRQMVRSYHKAEPEFTGNAATEYGTSREPGAIVDFAMDAGYTVRKVGFMVHESGWIGASPDGIVLDGQDGLALLEVKCPYRMRDPKGGTQHKPVSDYPHYYAQMQVQMLCANAQRCYFWQWASHTTHLDLVHRDNVWLTKHIAPLREFYELFLSEIDNPEHLKPLRKEIETASVAKLLREYDEVCDQLDFATTRKKEIIDELALVADGRDSLMCGRPFTKVEREGAVSYAQVVKKHCPDVDLEPYRGKPTSYWRLS